MQTHELFMLFRPYFEMAGLLSLAAVTYFVLFRASLRLGWKSSAVLFLRVGQLLMLASVLLPISAELMPREFLLRPRVQVWSGVSHATSKPYTLLTSVPVNAPPSLYPTGLRLNDRLVLLAVLLLLSGVLALIVRLLLRWIQTRKMLINLPLIKQVGQVSIRVSDDAAVPFSFWAPGQALVVIPTELLGRPGDFRIAVAHEVQHHRQRDTVWVAVVEFFKALFFWNPAVYAWARIMAQVQEFACDEVLIGRRKVSAQAYGHCLLRAAQSAVGSRNILVGTTSMAASTSGQLLKRRIEMLFNESKQSSSKWLAVLVSFGTLGLMATAAFASHSLIQDRAIALNEARRLAAHASEGSAFPIEMNDLVLRDLNLFLGTPDGRQSVKAGLARMPMYRPMIEGKIREYGLPLELLAVPLHESRYRNDLTSRAPFSARGMWQFIPGTARTYDLLIDDRVDERLDPEKETVAAMKYLRTLYGLFHDWRLAFKGYNEGESRVQHLIDEHHTRDPWELERASTSEGYLSGMMAMIIIMKNPSILD